MLRCLLVAALAAPPAPSAAPPASTAPVSATGATSAATPSSMGSSATTSSAKISPATTSSPTTSPVTTSSATTSPPPTTSPPTTSPPTTSTIPAPSAPTIPAYVETGLLELHATRVEGGPVIVRDAKGEVVANVQLTPNSRARLDLPSGEYAIEDSARGGRVTLSVGPDARAVFLLTPEGARGTVDEAPAPQRRKHPHRDPARPRWKKIGAPIFSAVVPGLGQMVNRQPGKGVGFLLGALALGVGSAVLMSTGGTDVSSKGLDSTSFGTEAIGAVGYGLLSGGLQLLYAAQIMDAYAVASGSRGPRPRTRHRVSLELTRMATVGLRPGDPAAGFFPDWSVSVLGQVARRFSVGVGDLAIKQGHGFARTTLQGGVRLHYRFLERDRIWLGAAAGIILQGSLGRADRSAVAQDAALGDSQGSFAAIPYGQLDIRFFILDRWSLNLTPRVSAPLGGPRFYNGPSDRAVPKHAATLELGTGVGVYF